MAGKVASCIKMNGLTMAMFAGVILGLVLGIGLRYSRDEPWNSREVMYIGYIGELFIRALKSIIIPLIVPSLIISIGSLDLSQSKRIGARAVTYYLTTTVLAIVLGIVLVLSIKPGEGVVGTEDQKPGRNVTTADTLMDLVRNLVPPNVVQATMQQTVTVLEVPMVETDTITLDDRYTWKFHKEFKDNSNILGLVMWSILFGVAISSSGKKGRTVLKFFRGVADITMIITQWLITLAPVGVLFLVASQVVKMKDVATLFKGVGTYFGTVVAGLFVHGLVVLPLLYSIFTRSSPFPFIANLASPMLTAFATASSSATLPVTMKTLEKHGIDSRVTRFVLPIGATINMDGTALYEAVAAIFIAQVRGIALSAGQVVAVSITATAASIGAAGIPQAGLVTMVMVLNTVGLPSSDIALILSVDWLLDRFRTATNVLGDAIGAGIVHHLSKKELKAMSDHDAEIRANGGMELDEENQNTKV